MKICFEIALKYMRYYKNKSLSILISIILAVSLIVGIGTIYNSAQIANIEQVRENTADYHFIYRVNSKQLNIIMNSNAENVSHASYYDYDKYTIWLTCAEENYIRMRNSKVIQGKMPTKKGEIALEEWMIRNLGMKPIIGEKVTFHLEDSKKDETFTLVGILKDMPGNKAQSVFQGFVAMDYNTSGQWDAYVKFDEQKDLKQQNNQLVEKMHYTKDVGDNQELLEAQHVTMKPDKITSCASLIHRYHLEIYAIMFVICMFSALVIYSVFQISTMQRISEYGLLEALGTNDSRIFTILLTELMSLLVIGFPIGTFIGIFCAKLFNQRFSSVLIGADVKAGSLIISPKIIMVGTLFLVLIMFVIAILMMKKLKKLTPIEAIQKSYKEKSSKPKGKKFYSLSQSNMINTISFKYIARKKSTFIGILLSLAIGGIIFICSAYAADLSKTQNELSIKADNDLISDYCVNIKISENDLTQGISGSEVQDLSNVEGVDKVHPIRYCFGGIVLNDNLMSWKNFFTDINQMDDYKNTFNGIYTKIGDGSNNYLLKCGIYGYDDDMIRLMNDYVYQGEIDIDKMKQDNLVLFRQLEDGSGSYEGLDIKPGDTITVKYQKEYSTSEQSLKFQDGQEYVVKEFVVGATIKRIAASNGYFIGNLGGDIVMTNDQFKNEFGIDNYNIVSITKKDEADHIKVSDEINQIATKIPNCVMRDLTVEIVDRNDFVSQQLMFIYGVTLILFIIGLFNILNNIGYNVLSRMNEFGVLRAMGITDGGFWKMIIREGILYGILASMIAVVGSLIGQALVFYVAKRIYTYIDPHFTINMWMYIGVVFMNLIIGVIATVIPSYKITKLSIVEEIKRQE